MWKRVKHELRWRFDAGYRERMTVEALRRNPNLVVSIALRLLYAPPGETTDMYRRAMDTVLREKNG